MVFLVLLYFHVEMHNTDNFIESVKRHAVSYNISLGRICQYICLFGSLRISMYRIIPKSLCPLT